MTLLTTNYAKELVTAGKNSSLFNRGHLVTAGEVDSDYLNIKTAASAINLSEDEASILVEEIRSSLPINQDE